MTYTLNTSISLIDNFKNNIGVNRDFTIKYYTKPYNHIVINNFLQQDTCDDICKVFPSFIARSPTPYGQSSQATSRYEAYITGLNRNDFNNKSCDIFISSYLQEFLTNIFNTKTNQYIASSAHLHKNPSKSGFIHRDFAVCSFKKSESLMLSDKYDYTDDSEAGGESIVKTMRSVVFLYYLNNPENIENYTGGGTGIYDSFNSKLIKEVRPKNNSLFAFEITPNSYHAYVGANFTRSAIVQWYHSSPAYMLDRHWDSVVSFYKQHHRILDTWRARNNYWKFENDPEYNLYFNDSINNLIQNKYLI